MRAVSVVWGITLDSEVLFRVFTLTALASMSESVSGLAVEVVNLREQVRVLAQVQTYRACNGELCEYVRKQNEAKTKRSEKRPAPKRRGRGVAKLRVSTKDAVIIILTAAFIVASVLVLDLWSRLDGSGGGACKCDCTWSIEAEEATVRDVHYQLTVPGESLDHLAEEVDGLTKELKKGRRGK